MPQPDLTIVIPAYNEVKRIVPTINSVRQYLKDNKIKGEVIVVDDGSVDSTELAVTGLADRYLKQPQNMGKGAAIRRGMLEAKGKDVLMMDADGSAPITELDSLMRARRDADIVIGSRHLDGSVIHVHQSLLRQTGSYAINLILRSVLKLPYADTQCGFKLFSNQSAKAIFSQTIIDRWAMDAEVLTIARMLGYKILEVPIAWHDARGSTFRAGRAGVYTLQEILLIWLYVKLGKYKFNKLAPMTKEEQQSRRSLPIGRSDK